MSRDVVRVDAAKSPQALTLMVSRGAPRYVLRYGTIEVGEHMLLPATHPSRRPITPQQQMSSLRRSIEAPTSGSWWMVVGTDHDEDLAMSVALGIMLRATIKNAESPSTCQRPLMWPLYGGTYDRLRDREDYRSGVGTVGLLILTNLAENSTREKLEKARDLLSMYASVPRILVVSGSDPLAFALDHLHSTPTRVLNLRRAANNHRRIV